MPILAVENVTDTFPIPIDFVGNSECFMLTVRGRKHDRSGNIRRRLHISKKNKIMQTMEK